MSINVWEAQEKRRTFNINQWEEEGREGLRLCLMSKHSSCPETFWHVWLFYWEDRFNCFKITISWDFCLSGSDPKQQCLRQDCLFFFHLEVWTSITALLCKVFRGPGSFCLVDPPSLEYPLAIPRWLPLQHGRRREENRANPLPLRY